MYARCIEKKREDGIRLSICTSIHSAGGAENGLLTLYPPRGGEISPPLEKMWYNFYVDLAKFFNS